jgi:hypothetical protein
MPVTMLVILARRRGFGSERRTYPFLRLAEDKTDEFFGEDEELVSAPLISACVPTALAKLGTFLAHAYLRGLFIEAASRTAEKIRSSCRPF